MFVIILVGLTMTVASGTLYILRQASAPPDDPANSEAARIERDSDPTLPGEFVDLPKIYRGFYGNQKGANTASHVQHSMDYASDQGLPPAGGPHWSGNCGDDPNEADAFCGPVKWGIYRKPWDAESLVHSMEHAGVVIWYDTADKRTIADLEAFLEGQLKDGKFLVLAPYPKMADESIAITAWSRRDKFPVSQYTRKRLETFIKKFNCRFDPQNMC